MVWLYVPGLAVSNSECDLHSEAVTASSAAWEGTSMQPRSWRRAWRMAPWIRRLSGMTSPPILSRPRLCLNPRFAELLMGLPPGWTSVRSPIDPIAFARWAIRFALHVRRLLCSTSSSATEVTDDHRRMPS